VLGFIDGKFLKKKTKKTFTALTNSTGTHYSIYLLTTQFIRHRDITAVAVYWMLRGSSLKMATRCLPMENFLLEKGYVH